MKLIIERALRVGERDWASWGMSDDGLVLVRALAAWVIATFALVGCSGAVVGPASDGGESVDVCAPLADAPTGTDAGAPEAEADADVDSSAPRDPCVPNPDHSQEDGCGINGQPTGWDTSAACAYRGAGCTVFGVLLCCPSPPDGGAP